jgi:CBS domain-containing protein
LDHPKADSAFAKHIMAAEIADLELDPAVVVEDGTNLGDIVDALSEKGKGCALICREGRIVGIFGERDILLNHAHREDDWRADSVRDHMIREPVMLKSSATIAHALNKMDIGDYRHVPVVDEDEKPLGILSVKCVLRHLQDWMDEDA